jgi:resuscitation-promoting factor RpfB
MRRGYPLRIHSFPRMKKRLLLLLPLLVLAALFWLAGSIFPANAYTVYADGEVVAVSGNYERVGDVLAAAGIVVRAEDRVTPPLTAAASPGEAIQIQRAQAVTLKTDSGSRTVWTRQPHLGAFLREAGVRVQRTDQVYADGRQVPFNGLDLAGLPAVVEIGRFVTVIVYNGEQQLIQRTAAPTVGQLLAELGIVLYAADGVEPPLGSWLEPNMEIFIRQSMPLRIAVDGRLLDSRSHHTNVLDVLADAGIGLVGQDYTRPGPEETLRPGDTIEVVRVTEDFRLEDRPIPFQTLWQATDQLELDQRALLSAGVPGILRQRIRVRYENGMEVSQTPDGEWVALEPVNEVIGYGTQIVIRTLETPEGVLEYWRLVRMRVTSYTAASSGKAPDHPAYGITASGLPAGTGIVAIDRNVVPFRSWVYVPGYGHGFAGDTGGGVRGRWIDLGYTENEYRSWSGYVDVYYLTPVPEPNRINYLLPANLP